MKSIGGLNAIGSVLPPNQIGGEDFIRHIRLLHLLGKGIVYILTVEIV